MQQKKAGKSLTLKMHLIARLSIQRFDQRARSVGLTSAQWRTIVTVRANEGATQRRIADLLDVSEVTAGRMIDKLIDEGIVERRRDAVDRRAYRVFSTPAAAPMLAQLEILGQEEEGRAMAGLSAVQIDELNATLDHIIANLGGVAAVSHEVGLNEIDLDPPKCA